jgi:hypothetical protein
VAYVALQCGVPSHSAVSLWLFFYAFSGADLRSDSGMPRRACALCRAEFECPASFQGKAPKCRGCRRATHGGRQHARTAAGSALENDAASALQPDESVSRARWDPGQPAPRLAFAMMAHQRLGKDTLFARHGLEVALLPLIWSWIDCFHSVEQQAALDDPLAFSRDQLLALGLEPFSRDRLLALGLEPHDTVDPHDLSHMTATCHMTPCACHCAACHAAGHGRGVCILLCAGLHDLFEGQHDVVDVVLRQMWSCGCTILRRWAIVAPANNRCEWTPLHAASCDGNLDAVREIIAAGEVYADQWSTTGYQTPLYCVAYFGKGNYEIAEALVRAGARRDLWRIRSIMTGKSVGPEWCAPGGDKDLVQKWAALLDMCGRTRDLLGMLRIERAGAPQATAKCEALEADGAETGAEEAAAASGDDTMGLATGVHRGVAPTAATPSVDRMG